MAHGSRLGRGANHIQLTDDCVSTRHLEFRTEVATWVLKDLNSTNGTFINNHRIGQGCVPINPGLEFCIADEVRLRIEAN